MDTIAILHQALGGRTYGIRKPPNRTILEAVEHETIPLPTDVVGPGGYLDIYSDVFKYFRVRFERGLPVLQLERYVGYIPLNDRHALQVNTRVPVGNLERIIGLADGYDPILLANYVRTFAHNQQRPLSLLDVLAGELLLSFDRIWEAGLSKEYQPERKIGYPTGKIDPFRSAWKTAQSGQPKGVSTVFQRTTDFGPNRLIKAAIERLLVHYRDFSVPDALSSRLRQLRRASRQLGAVKSPSEHEISPEMISRYLKWLPQFHENYADAIVISKLILSNMGLTIRDRDGVLVLPSILIDLSDIFERYMRVMLANGLAKLPDVSVKNGNKDGAGGARVQMFANYAATQTNPTVTPDIVIVHGTAPKLIIDTKHKPSKVVPAREDINQVLTYAVRYDRKRVMVLYSERKAEQPPISYVGAVGDVEVYVGRINLIAAKMDEEENSLVDAVSALLLP